MYRKLFLASLVTTAVAAFPAAACAQEVESQPPRAAEIAPLAADVITPASPAASVTDAPVIAAAQDTTLLSDDDLLLLRGGQAIVVGNQTLTAISNGNAFTGDYTAGNIALSDNALSNFNGLGNLVINTGAQNNLQSAMNVTINFAQ
jgi:hypothetical protein